MKSIVSIAIVLFIATDLVLSVQDINQASNNNNNSTSTSVTQKLFTYAGPLLPSDWSLVSILNDRAVIGFKNGSARNSPMEEFELKDRTFLQRLQNGTVYSTPLSSAKEKIAQWSSSVTSTVSKFGKSFRDQFDTLINNNNNNKKDSIPSNVTTTIIQAN